MMESFDHPFVSVIVPVYNDPDGLRACLTALREQTYSADAYEVIAVDNNSNEPIDGIVADFPHAVAAYESKQGAYAARNRGIQVGEGELLAFTDADCIPEKSWIESGVRCLSQTTADYVGGPVEIFVSDPRDPSPVGLYDALTSFRQRENLERKGFSATANMITSRRVFQEVGLFDERLKGGGDREWGKRARSMGFEASFCEASEVRHPARESLSSMLKKERRVARGRYRERSLSGGEGLLWYTLNKIRPPFGLTADIFLEKYRSRSVRKRVEVLMVCMAVRWVSVYEIVKNWLLGK